MDIEFEREREQISPREIYLMKRRAGVVPTEEERRAFADNFRSDELAELFVEYSNELKGKYQE